MLTLMIVDDELWVCALLRQIVDWRALGYELVAEAHDGHEALRMIDKHRPDVVLTDIRIPGIDGIAMVENARKLGCNAEFIVISGYEDFEYAKSAIRAGVLDYILKPVEGDYLRALMCKTHARIMQRRLREGETTQIKRRLDQSVYRLRDIYLKDVLQNRLADSDRAELQQLARINQEFEMSLREGVFRVMLCKPDLRTRPIEPEYYKLLLRTFQDTLEQRLGSICHEIVALWEGTTRLLCVLNYAEDMRKPFAKASDMVFDALRAKFLADFGMELSGGLGCEVHAFHQLYKSYENAVCGLAARIVLGTGRLHEVMASSGAGGKTHLSLNQEMKLLNLFDAGDRDATYELLESLFSAENKRPELAYKLYALAQDTVSVLYQQWRDKAPELIKQLPDEEDYRDADILSSNSTQALIESIMRLLNMAWEAREKQSNEQGNRIVNMAKAVITQRYQENINLNEVAAAVHVNASYLSDLFRRETGVVFTQYLTGYRMEIAKELLIDRRYRIVDVADLVGYRDVNYFSRQFKKVVGISAASYRRMHL